MRSWLLTLPLGLGLGLLLAHGCGPPVGGPCDGAGRCVCAQGDRCEFDCPTQHDCDVRCDSVAVCDAGCVDRCDLALDVGEATNRVGWELVLTALLEHQLLSFDGFGGTGALRDGAGGHDDFDHLGRFVGAVLHPAHIVQGQEGSERPDDDCSDEDQRFA